MRDHTRAEVAAVALSLIAPYDQVVVINDEEIVEQGTYQTLLDKRGFYYQPVQRAGDLGE